MSYKEWSKESKIAPNKCFCVQTITQKRALVYSFQAREIKQVLNHSGFEVSSRDSRTCLVNLVQGSLHFFTWWTYLLDNLEVMADFRCG